MPHTNDFTTELHSFNRTVKRHADRAEHTAPSVPATRRADATTPRSPLPPLERTMQIGHHGRLAAALSRLAALRKPRPSPAAQPDPHDRAVGAGTDGPGSAPEAAAAERRAFPRRESGCVVSIYRRRDGEHVSRQQLEWLLHASRLRGRLADLSMNGVAFVLREPMEPGERLELRLVHPRLDTHLDTTANVVRTCEVAPGEWKIVCRLAQNLTLDQVHEMSRLFGTSLV